jgi:N6-L-threonylcarbamoyladenine synthase
MKILAIESSCDDTSAGIIDNSVCISNIISSQNFHTKYGGIVPELASRAHIQIIDGVVKAALDKSKINMQSIDGIAVTSEPGLIGSLIVGSNYAKGLALKYNLPLIAVNHIEGHIYSGSLQDKELTFPYITLVVSGGHTALFNVNSYNDYEIIGLTRDDAAGEAFDKIAKLLGMGYPGGPQIDRISKEGNAQALPSPEGRRSESGSRVNSAASSPG